VLHDFICNNRAELIARCIEKVLKRFKDDPIRRHLGVGIPLFLDQLVRTLEAEERGPSSAGTRISGPSGGDSTALSEMGLSAAAHGKELLRIGYSVDQVVHDYGDLCQAVTELAFERDAPFEVQEFKVLNRCLDNAIADAVTEFSAQRDIQRADQYAEDAKEEFAFVMHELRNSLHAASLAVSAMEAGSLPLVGATGSVLKRSLTAMNRLIEDSLINTHSAAASAIDPVRFSVAEFIAEAEDAAQLYSTAKNCTFTVTPVAPDLHVCGDRSLLLAALTNLLTNAFKFTHRQSEVTLRTYPVVDRLFIEVADHCGGLPTGDVERLFVPFSQHGSDRSGIGLGLSIARRSVEASEGTLTVMNKPGVGCVFRINLPCHPGE